MFFCGITYLFILLFFCSIRLNLFCVFIFSVRIFYWLEYIFIFNGIDARIIVEISISIISFFISIVIVDIIIYYCDVWFTNLIVMEGWILIIILMVRTDISGIIRVIIIKYGSAVEACIIISMVLSTWHLLNTLDSFVRDS